MPLQTNVQSLCAEGASKKKLLLALARFAAAAALEPTAPSKWSSAATRTSAAPVQISLNAHSLQLCRDLARHVFHLAEPSWVESVSQEIERYKMGFGVDLPVLISCAQALEYVFFVRALDRRIGRELGDVYAEILLKSEMKYVTTLLNDLLGITDDPEIHETEEGWSWFDPDILDDDDLEAPDDHLKLPHLS